MRAAWAMAVGLAFIGAGCSGSSSGSGTTGASTTGSGSTGTTGSLPAGAECTADTACASGICGVSAGGSVVGTEHCCSSACATSDPVCGARGCSATGTCTYPQPSVLCGSSCANAIDTPSFCTGSGSCETGTPAACPNSLACSRDGGCNTTCAASRDCATGFVCNAGACVVAVATGSCTEADDCTSGICGTQGGAGNCCAASCAINDPTCGATGCALDGGACLYPDATTTCGPAQSCAAGIETAASLCDGKGACPAPGTKACTPFVCGATACQTSCTDATSCISGEFCDVANATCCGGLASRGVIAVDSTTGSDSNACCGVGSHGACQTIAHAMAVIDSIKAQGVTIKASVNGAGGDWGGPEIYPIVLGWGAELKAPGVYFVDPAGGQAEILDIKLYSSSDQLGTASIVGAAGNPVGIGMSSSGTQSSDLAAIQVETGATLYLANASVNGSASNQTTAIAVAGGSSLVLGGDSSSQVIGTVTIGNNLNDSSTDGYDGIVCGTAGAQGCTISDVAGGGSSVIIQGQEDADLEAGDGSTITLSASPTIGISPSAVGFNTCPGKPDLSASNGAAIVLSGGATLTLANGTLQCLAGDGIDLVASANGVPTLTLKKSTVQNTERAIYASAGTATVLSSTLQFNYNGVEQAANGTHTGSIDLSGGQVGGVNTVACCNSTESVAGSGNPAVCVLNTTDQPLAADNVDWDTSGPDLFQCDGSLGSCSCAIASCTAGPGSDGMDAVYETNGASTITSSGNGLSPILCD